MSLQNQIRQYNDDFQSVDGGDPGAFFCPITHMAMHPSEEMCKGHVVPGSLGGTNWVTQVAAVDNFFGAVVEADCSIFNAAKDLHEHDILLDQKLARFTKPTLHINGQEIDFYPSDKRSHRKGTPIFSIERNGVEKWFGMKVSNQQCREFCSNGLPKIEVRVLHDFESAFVGMLVHSAHLTMFSLLGYRYALSVGGSRIGFDILGQFYMECEGSHAVGRKEKRDYFQKFGGLVRPMSSNFEELKGTIHDNQMLLAIDSQSRPWAFIVIVPTKNMRFAVLIPTGDTTEQLIVFEEYMQSPFEYLGFRMCRLDRDSDNWKVSPDTGRIVWTAK